MSRWNDISCLQINHVQSTRIIRKHDFSYYNAFTNVKLFTVVVISGAVAITTACRCTFEVVLDTTASTWFALSFGTDTFCLPARTD